MRPTHSTVLGNVGTQVPELGANLELRFVDLNTPPR
jgi:hypothetical protein